MTINCKLDLHTWDGCKCSACGKIRDEYHSFKIENCKVFCSRCGIVKEAHLWDGCICSKCNEIRNEGHYWYGCKCKKCGKAFPSNLIRDFGGGTYTTIKIGEQEWLSSNLNTYMFRNGDYLYSATTEKEWIKAMNEKIPARFRGFYNWYAVSDPRGLSPEGSHIPNKVEFETLINVVHRNGVHLISRSNGYSFKEHDKTGFSAMFDGYHDSLISRDKGFYAHFWSTTETDSSKALGLTLSYRGDVNIYSGFNKEGGLSVRCLKDLTN